MVFLFFTTTNYVYEQQRGKKTLLSLTLICYCHLVGMAKIVRGSTFSTTMRHRYLTIWLTYCTKPGIALALYYNLISTLFFRLVAEHSMLMFIRGLLNFCKYQSF